MRLLCQQGSVACTSKLATALATTCKHRTSTMRSRVHAPPGAAPGTTGMGSGSAAGAWRVVATALRPLSARSANAWSLQGADLQERGGQQGGQAEAVLCATAVWGSRPQGTASLEHIPRSQAFAASSSSRVHCCIQLIASAVCSLPTAQPHKAAAAATHQYALTPSAVRPRCRSPPPRRSAARCRPGCPRRPHPHPAKAMSIRFL